MTGEEFVLQIDNVQKQLPKLSKMLDEVKSSKESRELHDFIQDELLPIIKLIADDTRTLAEIVAEHDELISNLSPEDNGTQIESEHAKELIEHIEACNAILTQMVEMAKGTGQDVTPVQQRIEVGKALINFINSVVMEDSDDEDEDEDEEDGSIAGRQN